jgi:hypothetical protein
MIYVGRRAILYPPPNRANHESSRKCRPTRLRADVLIVRLRSWATVNGFYSPDVVPPGLPPLVIRVALLEAQRRAGSEGTVVGVPVDPSLRTACGCRCRRLSQLIRTGRDGEALRVDALEIGATAMLNSVLFSSPSTATCPPSRLLAGPVTRRLLPRALVARPAGPRLEPLAMLGSFLSSLDSSAEDGWSRVVTDENYPSPRFSNLGPHGLPRWTATCPRSPVDAILVLRRSSRSVQPHSTADEHHAAACQSSSRTPATHRRRSLLPRAAVTMSHQSTNPLSVAGGATSTDESGDSEPT